ncbi:MAG: ATPase domain-containing protein [Thermoproteus sp. AZ2]|uniref:ATPase domain-containing protein n=1 Tax=Thermoproteus sp. AZ2 TaxID=1609232 RepID=A0ACC6UYJ2_9CREN
MDFRGVTAVVGRPGTGKTTLAMRIAHERLARGEAVLWISLNEDRGPLPRGLQGPRLRLG